MTNVETAEEMWNRTCKEAREIYEKVREKYR